MAPGCPKLNKELPGKEGRKETQLRLGEVSWNGVGGVEGYLCVGLLSFFGGKTVQNGEEALCFSKHFDLLMILEWLHSHSMNLAGLQALFRPRSGVDIKTAGFLRWDPTEPVESTLACASMRRVLFMGFNDTVQHGSTRFIGRTLCSRMVLASFGTQLTMQNTLAGPLYSWGSCWSHDFPGPTNT